MDTFSRLKTLLENRGIKTGQLTESSTLKEIGIDSLDLVEVLLELEKQLNVTFSDDELLGCKSISDVVNLVAKKK
ncbi:MAG: acyl carrier protein [Erysipelotrichaceae bacterium]|nr:acyl carrier protein [Erysipelotrichaceae bacterium]MDP3304828.1 acyl carrier protein [Erysipelotrichaceae bacterium]